MFSKKLKSDSFSSLIAFNNTVTGSINFSGALKIQGGVCGDIIGDGSNTKGQCVIIDETGTVVASKIDAFDAIISGKVVVDKLVVENILRVTSKASIKSQVIYYRELEIEPGAVIEGQLKNLDHCSEGEMT